LEFFNSLIENTVLFAKIVPYFMEMHEADRITLLKSCVFEIICIRHAALVKHARFYVPVFECYVTRETLGERLPECKTFIDLLFDFCADFSVVELTDAEIAIFCAYLLFNAEDDPQLNDSEKLSNFKELFRSLLIHEMGKRPVGKQLANEAINEWIQRCCVKLKELNVEHSNILFKCKSLIQFPDLYAELYNL